MSRFFTLLLLISLATSPTQAQQGHPLVGTWQGEWGDDEQLLTLILEWDGKTISGIVNPGPHTTELGSVTLDSSTWTVTIDTDLENEAGETFRFKAQGQLDNIGSPERVLKAEWNAGSRRGTMTLERQGGA